MKFLKLLIAICFCLGSLNIYAQSPATIEADLLKTFKKINYWDQKQNDGRVAAEDSLAMANDVFGKKLKLYTGKYPFTISQKFASLKAEYLDISDSEDGLFRIYSWDTKGGGTMHFFENVFQYKLGIKTNSILDTPKTEGDNRPNYNRIFTFKADNQTYYLAVYLTIASNREAGAGIHIFTVENGKLKDAKLIKTHSGLHSDLSYDYDFGSVVNIDFKKRPVIRFDNATNTIYLPLVDGNRKVTNKFILYKFNGKYFEKMNN